MATILICGHGSGTPSVKELEAYCTSRYKKVAPNGVHKGIVAVKRLNNLGTTAEQKKFHDTYKTILGRNIYSQPKREYVFAKYKDGKYYSDCSSSGMKSFAKAGLYSGATLNTAGIYTSSKFVDVPVVIEEGHIMNPEVLQVGDALLFAGDDPKRPEQIGHVEWAYEIGGKPSATPVKMTVPSHTIKKGAKGLDVKYLQLCLNKAINAKLDIDGSAGTKTISALKKWQAVSGLTSDGSYGPASEAMMRKQFS